MKTTVFWPVSEVKFTDVSEVLAAYIIVLTAISIPTNLTLELHILFRI
jgi:hypothetical protein